MSKELQTSKHWEKFIRDANPSTRIGNTKVSYLKKNSFQTIGSIFANEEQCYLFMVGKDIQKKQVTLLDDEQNSSIVCFDEFDTSRYILHKAQTIEEMLVNLQREHIRESWESADYAQQWQNYATSLNAQLNNPDMENLAQLAENALDEIYGCGTTPKVISYDISCKDPRLPTNVLKFCIALNLEPSRQILSGSVPYGTIGFAVCLDGTITTADSMQHSVPVGLILPIFHAENCQLYVILYNQLIWINIESVHYLGSGDLLTYVIYLLKETKTQSDTQLSVSLQDEITDQLVALRSQEHTIEKLQTRIEVQDREIEALQKRVRQQDIDLQRNSLSTSLVLNVNNIVNTSSVCKDQNVMNPIIPMSNTLVVSAASTAFVAPVVSSASGVSVSFSAPVASTLEKLAQMRQTLFEYNLNK
jgi:hypothetical protein